MVKINKVIKGYIFGKNSFGWYKNILCKVFERIRVKMICSIVNVVILVKIINKWVSWWRMVCIFYKYCLFEKV